MSLSLALRKNIRDSEAKRNENLEAIKAATGVDFALEVDFAVLMSKIAPDYQASYATNLGDVVHDWYLTSLSYGLKTKCQDEMNKESLVEACTAKKISFQIVTPAEWDSVGYGYCCRIRVINGVLMMECKPDYFGSNVDYLWKDFEKCFAGQGGLTLKARAGIRDSEAERQGHLDAINAAAGTTFTFECDWATLSKPAVDRGYEDRAGEVVAWHLGGFKKNVCKILADEMGKEAFLDKCPAKVIRFVVDATIPSGKVTRFVNGGVNMCVKPDYLGSNVDDTGNDIESQL